MPRASRHHIPGQIWHITHRCHQGEFLFRFSRDRKRWLWWLFEAKKRFGLSILNYMVTSNHIHLLVEDDDSNAISKSIQLIASRTAQEFNQRKGRKGAYWTDRYHATAIEKGSHLIRCLVYIDMNMVRAGVVAHPSEWPHCGYHEIQCPPQRYALINRDKLTELCGLQGESQLKMQHQEWIEKAIQDDTLEYQEKWSHAVAVGSVEYVGRLKEMLCIESPGRRVRRAGDEYILCEPEMTDHVETEGENSCLSADNLVYFDESLEVST